jgi:hypothetical protein
MIQAFAYFFIYLCGAVYGSNLKIVDKSIE